MASRGVAAASGRASAATSGHNRGRCCTWTWSNSPVSRCLATAWPATGAARDLHRGIGYDYLHCIVDDHSRLAYVELHRREDKHTNARTLERAVAWFTELGLAPPEAVMTDNALVYVRSRPFREALAQIGARHITPPPYTPRWNGKAERFIQTLQNEWAYAHSYPSSTARSKSLGSFLRYYNRRRPHSSIGDRPPISRVHNLRGQDT
jgi:transposase InsO family protein